MGMHVWTKLTNTKRKEEAGRGDLAPILVFLALDCVGEVFSRLACCVLGVGADARSYDDGG